MKRIYSSSLIPVVENIKNLLESQGIQSTITNEFLSVALGEIPPIECWPQLWVSEEDEERARQIIRSIETESNLQTEWMCSNCQEKSGSQFTECWSCGASRVPE